MSEFNEDISADDSGPSMDETISTAWAEISKGMAPPTEPVRAPDGKFTKTDVANDEPEAPVEEAAPVIPKKKPSGWKPDVLAKWDTIEPDVQDEFLRREEDFHKGTEQYKQHAEIGKRMENAYRPYEANFRGLGVEADVAVAELFKTDHQLRHGNAAQKAAMVANLIQAYGVDPNSVFSQFQAPQQSEIPEVNRLYQELNALKAQQQQREQRDAESQKLQAQREVETLNSEVSKFSQGKEHFAAVEQEMLALLPTIKAANPASSPAELLQMTYDRAIYANPQVRALVLAKQQEDAKASLAKTVKSAKEAASVNLSQKGKMAVAAPKRTIEEQIRDDATRLGLI
jgi:hypothetical protein